MSTADMATGLAENFINPIWAEDASPIRDFLRDKTVFLTGGFGFIGKLLVQKLLECDVKRIYMMVRGKKGKSVEDRLEVLREDPVFETILNLYEDPFAKLTLIEGDMQEIGLGISNEHREKIINEVELVFHAAADVRFDESLREVTKINVRGTREIMLLSQQIQNLDVLVYVSTAFCTPGLYVKEKFYKTNLDPDFMINVVENLRPEDYDAFDAIARRIIQPYPNTYTYTKALAEHIVRKYSGNMKVAISRPSIIATTFTDPLPGYTDNIYGVNGVVAGAGVGIIRILHINDDLKANIVPADLVVNSIVSVAWFTVFKNKTEGRTIEPGQGKGLDVYRNYYHDYDDEKIKIYHCIVPDNNRLIWGNFRKESTRRGLKFPVINCLWIVTYNTTKYFWMWQILKIFYHFIPAVLMDIGLRLMNKKPKIVNLYRKVNKFSEVLSFFTNNEWTFEYGNSKQMCQEMSKRDRVLFDCNMEELDWLRFLDAFCLGIRRHIFKEEMSTVPAAEKKYLKMQIAHFTMLALVYSALAYIGYHLLKFYGIMDFGEYLLTKSKSSVIGLNK